MQDLLDHDNIEMRNQFREFLKGDLFKPRYNLTLDEERELALKRLQVKQTYSHTVACIIINSSISIRITGYL